jgi:hypothetical protein
MTDRYTGPLFVYLNKHKDFSMDDKQQQVISCKVSPDEAETIKARATALGISVSEYMRNRALAPPSEASTNRLEDLVKHTIYTINQIHTAIYSIAEAQGKAGRFLSTEQLREVYNRVRADAIRYAVQFPSNFEAVQAEIAAATKNGG